MFLLKTGRTSFVAGIKFHFTMGQEKWVVSIEIYDIDALSLAKKHFNPLIDWESKFVFKMGRTLLLARITFLFVTCQDKWVDPIGIQDIDALVS